MRVVVAAVVIPLDRAVVVAAALVRLQVQMPQRAQLTAVEAVAVLELATHLAAALAAQAS
jgi:hypothetical protein